jgi:macrophage erythroblast attacher
MVDLDFFKTAQRIEDALQRHDTGPCLSWCQDNKSKLKRIKSRLEFRVKIQDFVEMIKVNQRMEAIRYARTNFTAVEPSMMAELQEAMALLAFRTDTKCKKYQRLFSDDRWADLIQLFRNENLSLHQLCHCSLLSATIQAGLSALKTPYPH